MDPEQLIQLVHLLKTLGPAERATLLTEASVGFDAHVGMRFVWAADDRVVAELPVGSHHVQPYGLVHGGIYCALAEAVCSVGAALRVLPGGHHAVGVENHTRFLRAAREGAVLTVTAVPSGVAGQLHTWQATVRDAEGTCCAESTVVVRALPPGKRVAGQQVALRTRLPPVD